MLWRSLGPVALRPPMEVPRQISHEFPSGRFATRRTSATRTGNSGCGFDPIGPIPEQSSGARKLTSLTLTNTLRNIILNSVSSSGFTFSGQTKWSIRATTNEPFGRVASRRLDRRDSTPAGRAISRPTRQIPTVAQYYQYPKPGDPAWRTMRLLQLQIEFRRGCLDQFDLRQTLSQRFHRKPGVFDEMPGIPVIDRGRVRS